MNDQQQPDKTGFEQLLNQQLDSLVQHLEAGSSVRLPSELDSSDILPGAELESFIKAQVNEFLNHVSSNGEYGHEEMLTTLSRQLDQPDTAHYANIFPSALSGEQEMVLDWFRLGIIHRLDPDHVWTFKLIRSGSSRWPTTETMLQFLLDQHSDEVMAKCIRILADQTAPVRVRKWLSNSIPLYEHDPVAFYSAIRRNLLNPDNDWASFSINLELLLDQEASPDSEPLVRLFAEREMLLACIDECYTGKRKQRALVILDALMPAFNGISGAIKLLHPDCHADSFNGILLKVFSESERESVRLWALDNLVLPDNADDVYETLLRVLGSQHYPVAAIASQVLARDPGRCISQITALANNRYMSAQSRLYAISSLAQQAIDVTVLLDSIPDSRIELPPLITTQLRQTMLRECALLDPLDTDVRWLIEYFCLPDDDSDYDYASLVQSVARSCHQRKILDSAELEDIVDPEEEVPYVIYLYEDPNYEHDDADIHNDTDDDPDETDTFHGDGMSVSLSFSPIAPFVSPYAGLSFMKIIFDNNPDVELSETSDSIIDEWNHFFSQKKNRKKLATIRKITDPLGLVWLDQDTLEYRFEGMYGNDNSGDGTFTVTELLFPEF